NAGAFDYHLAWYGPGDWSGYTRNYPPGTYYIYLRSAGFGLYNMNLDQVVRGAGTVNQVLQRLGRWSTTGKDNPPHDWVPLTDSGLVAPVSVTLKGTSTLRITTTTGDCFPSYFMLVPASGINFSGKKSEGNVMLSFPSQPGVVYRVFSRTDLNTGSW